MTCLRVTSKKYTQKIISYAAASAVHINYTESFCDYNRNKYVSVCPSGTIKRINLAENKKCKSMYRQRSL